MGSSPSGVGKPSFQTNGAHGLQDPEEINGNIKEQMLLTNILRLGLYVRQAQTLCQDGKMVFGGSQQETLEPGFVLLWTRQQGVPVVLRELVFPDGFDPM
ncbi:unnamed protein product [Schistosoma mattheei]|uniref:Uncharacterized protein n=1 Tax=Schistosoma mattheei TaxID=31246 RepID=A0A183P4H9_9TREM|nr:unnamed protein product [Schistosoma mattheei]